MRTIMGLVSLSVVAGNSSCSASFAAPRKARENGDHAIGDVTKLGAPIEPSEERLTFEVSARWASQREILRENGAMTLANTKIAVLVTDGFEQVELTGPVEALKKAGASVTIVSPKEGKIQGMNHDQKGDQFTPDRPLSATKPDEFDGLLLPGGVANPDYLRVDEKAVAFVRAFVSSSKPIAAICHGPWTLIEAGGVKGHTMTSWPSLKSDLINAGARWVDQQVVVDGLLVTSRKPDDIPAFSKAFIEVLEGDGGSTRLAS